MFEDRYDAGRQLAQELHEYAGQKDLVIIAIPRGALEIGAILAEQLSAPLDVMFVKKIGAPGDPELAIGAVGTHQYSIDPGIYQAYKEYVDQQISNIQEALLLKSKKYRGEAPLLSVTDKVVILTDDGIATGNTLSLAVKLLKKEHPKKLIIAVPVGPPEVIKALSREVDEVICLEQPSQLMALGRFYRRFPQVDDEEAIRLLKEARR